MPFSIPHRVAHISRIARRRMAEPAEKVLKIADMVVDLGRKRPGIIERALFRCRLGVLPLTPQTSSYESQKRDDGGEHQSQ